MFSVSSLILKYLNDLELSTVQGNKSESTSFLLCVVNQFDQNHFLGCYFFFYNWYFWLLYLKLGFHQYIDVYLSSIWIPFINFSVFMWIYYSSFVVELEIGLVKPPIILLEFGCALIIHFFYDRMKVEIGLSKYMKTCVKILMELALNLYIAFSRMAIFSRLILQIHDLWRCFHPDIVFYFFHLTLEIFITQVFLLLGQRYLTEFYMIWGYFERNFCWFFSVCFSLLNMFLSYRNSSVGFFESHMPTIRSSASKNVSISFTFLISFSWLIALFNTLNTILTRKENVKNLSLLLQRNWLDFSIHLVVGYG